MEQIILLGWLILGLINITILYWMQKKHAQKIYPSLKYGSMHQLGVMVLWFLFGFVIIPWIVLRVLRRWALHHLVRWNTALVSKLNDYKK